MLAAAVATFLMLNLNPVAHAIVAEPMEAAADTFGFRVLGEFEFARRSSAVPGDRVRAMGQDLSRMCPQLGHAPGEVARVMILSWGDHEYPDARRGRSTPVDQNLARARGHNLARAMRADFRGELGFELIDMTTRTREDRRPGRLALTAEPTDLKRVLVDAGAAPTSDLELGLFGEYAQSSKSVAWVDCQPQVPTERAERHRPVRVAGANVALD